MQDLTNEKDGYDQAPSVVIMGQLFRVYVPSRPTGSVIAPAGPVQDTYPTWDIQLHLKEDSL